MKWLWSLLIIYLGIGAILGYMVVNGSTTAGTGEFITTMLAWPYLYFKTVTG